MRMMSCVTPGPCGVIAVSLASVNRFRSGDPAVPRRPGAPLDLGSLDLGFLEAALAADLIMA